MTRHLRAGIIGLGVGEQHLLGYRSASDCEVVSICDVDVAKLTEIGERYDIRGRHADYRKVTEDPNIDVISICSYDDMHAEQAISALRNGKHVMVEKPIALNRGDAERILAAQQENKRVLTSNLILRTSPRFRALKLLMDRGEMGEIFYLEGDYIHQILHKIVTGWRGRMSGYSVIHGGGVHLIDLMRWLLEDEVAEVCGMSNKILTADTGYPYDDTTVNILRFDRGALAKTTTTFGPQRTKFHPLNVYGTKATFINDSPDAKFFSGDRAEDEGRITDTYPGMKKGDLLPDFVDAIREGRDPEVTTKDVFRVMDICFAAVDALREARALPVTYLL